MDIPLSVSSVVTPYLGDNGYKFEGSNVIRVLSVSNGTLADYNEADAAAPFGAATLVAPAEQLLTLAYNKSMLMRIQNTQIQDIPVSQFAKQVALQQCDQVFVPAHDAYSIGKIYAARPVGNRQYIQLIGTGTVPTEVAKYFSRMVNKARTGGATLSNIVAWVGYEYATLIKDKINFTGSDAGYTDGKNGYIGKLAGVKVVEVPDAYLGGATIYAIAADKNAVVNVTPKMDPSAGGMVVIDKVPGFSGVEIQLRDRSDTFVLNKKVDSIASLEEDPAA
jgi:hypothetical protein